MKYFTSLTKFNIKKTLNIFTLRERHSYILSLQEIMHTVNNTDLTLRSLHRLCNQNVYPLVKTLCCLKTTSYDTTRGILYVQSSRFLLRTRIF